MQFNVEPTSSDVTLTQVVELSDSELFPTFITYNMNSQTNMIDIRILSTDTVNVGTYNLVIKAEASHINE